MHSEPETYPQTQGSSDCEMLVRPDLTVQLWYSERLSVQCPTSRRRNYYESAVADKNLEFLQDGRNPLLVEPICILA